MLLKYLLTYLILLFLWIFPAYYHHTITHDYMNGDDYTILKISQDIDAGAKYSDVLRYQTIEVFESGRLKPINIVVFVSQIFLLHDNYLYWNLYTLLLGIITSVILLHGFINLGFNLLPALLATIISFFGHQILIWYDHTAGEMHAMFFFALSLLTAPSIFNQGKKYTKLKLVCFLLATVVYSLSKETFILMLPASILIIYKSTNVPERLRIVASLFLLCVLLIELFICYKISKSFAGGAYSGIDLSTLSPTHVLRGSYLILKTEAVFWAILFGIFLIVENRLKTTNFEFKKNYHLFSSIIFLLPIILVVPQLIIFHRNGIGGFVPRFALPICIGFGVWVAMLLKKMTYNTGQSNFSKICFICIVLYTAYLNYRHGLCRVEVYQAQKASFRAVFDSIKTLNRNNEPVYLFAKNIGNDTIQIPAYGMRYSNIHIISIKSEAKFEKLNPKNILVFDRDTNIVYDLLHKKRKDFTIEKTYFSYISYLHQK